MALYKTEKISSGGGTLVETLLWQNPSPSASMSSQLITLSDDYTQYDLIKVVFKCASSGADDSKRYIRNVYQTPEDIQNTQNAVNYACAGLGRKGSSTSICDFIGTGTSNTNVNYYHLDTSNIIKPLYIYGVRYADNPVLVETTLWTNPNPSTAFANADITLGSSIDNYDYIKFYVNINAMNEVHEIICSVDEFKTSSITAPYWIPAIIYGASSSTYYIKDFYYKNTTTITVNGNNTNMIPTKITGIKYQEEIAKTFETFNIEIAGGSSSYTIPTNGRARIAFINFYNKTLTSNTYCNIADSTQSNLLPFGNLPAVSSSAHPVTFTDTGITISGSLSSSVYVMRGYIFYQ